MMKRKFPAAIDGKYNLRIQRAYVRVCTYAASYRYVEQSRGQRVSRHALSHLDTVRGAPSLV